MKRLLLVLVAATWLLPGAAHAAACSPLNCAASQFSLADGSLLGYRARVDAPVNVVDLQTGETKWRLPAGLVGANLLVHQNGTSLVWYDASLGVKVATAKLTGVASLAGVSQNGTRAVVTSLVAADRLFTIVTPTAQTTVTVPGKEWEFDALRGDNLFLIHYLSGGGYEVRLAHVGSRRLEEAPLKDPHESGIIWGQPFSRLASPDGRYLFTLYIGQNGGAMIHDLDLKTAKARCIDLPGTGNYGGATTWTMQLAKDGRTLWAVSPGYGRGVAIDIVTRKVTRAFRISLPGWFLGKGTASALSPDGSTLAVADGKTVALVDLRTRTLMSRNPGKAIALGYAPDGRLWTLS
jgi:hypothetical protein